MKAASSVKKELGRGVMIRKRKIDEQEQATDSNGDPWLRMRHRLDEMIRAANLGTPAEEMLLVRVREQLERMIQLEKAGAVNRQKAGKSMKADAFQDAAVSAIQQEKADPGDIEKAAKEVKAHAAFLSGENAGAAEWPKPTQFKRENLVKQSGQGLPRTAGPAGRPQRAPGPQRLTSEVPGVAWNKRDQKWRVEIRPRHRKKRIWGGYFTEKAAAQAKALELQEQHGLLRQVKPVSTLAELPVFSPKVPCPNVKWSQVEQQWHAVKLLVQLGISAPGPRITPRRSWSAASKGPSPGGRSKRKRKRRLRSSRGGL
eukprot:Skav205974  [mRNA]  locus=scaffold442:870118:871229:- [translate_table: standard]